MAELAEFTVLREHRGDLLTDTGSVSHHFYAGDIRLADPVTVASLVASGVLQAGAAVKAAPPLANKAERKLANKGESK